MNNARLALLLTGMAFILLAGAVLYYQTDLHKNVPEGVAIAVLLLLLGLFVVAFSDEFRRSRYRAIEHFDVDNPPVVQRTYVHDVDTVSPPVVPPPVTPTTRRRVREERVEERIERP